ncbi:MAG: response regulator transcription factor [Fimbriimonadaceae bacterium]|nr:response regulator transcription factor [Fimbriimonadaceae bacterium]
MHRILLVDDDTALADRLRLGLERAGYQVVWAPDGAAALALLAEQEYDLVLLDVLLPGAGGFEVCARLRQARRSVPVLMLTALAGVDDRVRGLDAGADDYLGKPFDFAELLARVRALLRRGLVVRARVIEIADLRVDTAARLVTRGGRAVRLTPREYELLEALASNPGRTVTREEILETVWRDDRSLSDTISVHVSSLRRKVDGAAAVKLIETVHGSGYVLRPPAEGVR